MPLLAIPFFLLRGADDTDVMLKAMQDELARSSSLRILNLDAPYYIEYRVEDAATLSVNATLGGLLNSSESAMRIPTVRIRVGDYKFDNTDHVYSDFYGGTRYDSDRLPLENDYVSLRQALWLSTDRAYKGATEAIARKRAALKSVNLPDQLPDFSKAEPVRAVLPVRRIVVNEGQWTNRTVRLSEIFENYPQILSSGVEFDSIQSTDYLVTSEGTVLRYPENLAYFRVRALAQAPDGSPVRDALVFQASDVNGLPPDVDLRRGVATLAENVTALSRAPRGDAYDGPVLFEPQAAAQLLGQLLGDNLKITRKPVAEPGRPLPYSESELENRVGSRILPEWMDVVDDPTQTEWRGHTLFGNYRFDMEGVSPKPLQLVEKGVLKSFLLTRTPALKGFESSNGRARMPGSFGARSAGFGNLFVHAAQTTTAVDLKKKLVDMCKQRNKPYGLLVRKLDYPSSASVEELRRVAAAMSQSGGGTRPVSLPILIYRVYPDGKEELVRGMRFRGLSTRSLKDILAASDEIAVFDFIDSPAPFALMGAGGFVTNASVIAPGILFDELELEPVQQEVPKPPIVPPPPLSGATR
jgi:hypothetical protein